jgi:hypothetical protein
MTSSPFSSDALTANWRHVREAYRLDGEHLTPAQMAGLLIEELGSVYAALRLVQVTQDAPLIIDFARPRFTKWRIVRELLVATWLDETGQEYPTPESLLAAWQARPEGTVAEDLSDAKALAGSLIEAHQGDLEGAIRQIGLGLYSPMHFTQGIAAHSLAREILFWLDLAATGLRLLSPVPPS